MILNLSKEEAFAIASGALQRLERPCKPQPSFYRIENVGDFWVWSPTEGRVFFAQANANAFALPELTQRAPFAPGDVVMLREPWKHLRTEPNGDLLVQYVDGVTTKCTPVGGKWTVRHPYGWNSSLNMMTWLSRMSAQITQVYLERKDSLSPWQWIYDFVLV